MHLLAQLGRRTWYCDHGFHEYSIVSLGAAVLRLNHELFGTACWLWSLHSFKESQPKYSNIDDGLPLTMVCVVPVAVAGCWLAGQLQSFIVDLAARR